MSWASLRQHGDHGSRGFHSTPTLCDAHDQRRQTGLAHLEELTCQAGFPIPDQSIEVEFRPRDPSKQWRVTFSGSEEAMGIVSGGYRAFTRVIIRMGVPSNCQICLCQNTYPVSEKRRHLKWDHLHLRLTGPQFRQAARLSS